MKVLCIGDVCGQSGRDRLLHTLPELKKKYNASLTIVNGENSAEGNGIDRAAADDIFAAGADVITGGNHTLKRRDVYELLDTNPFMLRPDNIRSDFGKGYATVDLGAFTVAVINLSGRVWMDECENPFTAADRLVGRATDDGIRVIIVDFHAEATSEKRALAEYLDGRVSALFGTHTHVPTADCRILKGGTGFITDIGMTGPDDSVLGVKKELSVAKIKDGTPVKFTFADGKCRLDGCVFEIDRKSGKCIFAERFSV